ncbi:REP-associated tyrosine transposase [Mucilaginibacter sp. X5P1]|uniref:REP-associated tyrosine transposase n=1 Tax=Mucilaginibacter sp. X5P1 TaxID=2723088 RepID=UPI00160F80F0|nr:transposase [Mucilaginibacter sp. X5P1]MBB6139168.1 REP element-mobilizing transposase RayT [Mucilaginibacter sp. X5P1]
MPSKYRIHNSQEIYFITFAVVEWVDALSRPYYKDLFLESLKYCQENKGFIIYAYVIMNNHVHLIASADEEHNLSDILRDLKKFTSKKLTKAIEENIQESRKRWMLWLFRSNGQRNSNNEIHQFWQQDNHPVCLDTAEMIGQRLTYLHNNPVAEGIVEEPEHYIYSSARDYTGIKGLLNVVFLY